MSTIAHEDRYIVLDLMLSIAHEGRYIVLDLYEDYCLWGQRYCLRPVSDLFPMRTDILSCTCIWYISHEADILSWTCMRTIAHGGQRYCLGPV